MSSATKGCRAHAAAQFLEGDRKGHEGIILAGQGEGHERQDGEKLKDAEGEERPEKTEAHHEGACYGGPCYGCDASPGPC